MKKHHIISSRAGALAGAALSVIATAAVVSTVSYQTTRCINMLEARPTRQTHSSVKRLHNSRFIIDSDACS